MIEDVQEFQARRGRDCHAVPGSNYITRGFPNIRIIVEIRMHGLCLEDQLAM